MTPYIPIRSPFVSVPKKEDSRRTITDGSQRRNGQKTRFKAWILKNWQRGAPAVLHLPSVNTILAGVKACRLYYPDSTIVLFYVDMSHFYRIFLVDPSQTLFLIVLIEFALCLLLKFALLLDSASISVQIPSPSLGISWTPSLLFLMSGLGKCLQQKERSSPYLESSCSAPKSSSQVYFILTACWTLKEERIAWIPLSFLTQTLRLMSCGGWPISVTGMVLEMDLLTTKTINYLRPEFLIW